MNRLTSRYDDGEAFCDKFSVVDDVGVDETILKGELIDKLAEYEDAEEQGLLHKMQVAINQIVYRINTGARNPIIPLVVTELRFKALRSGKVITKIMCSDDVAVKTDGCSVYYEEEIGKKIFLTSEEAEQALEAMKGGGK